MYTSSFNRSSLAWRPSAAEWSQDLQRTDDLQRDAVILQTFIQSQPLHETDMHKDMIARYMSLCYYFKTIKIIYSAYFVD